MTPFFLARQPIFDRKLQMHAYELLFRDSRVNSNRGALDDAATTAQVIRNAAEVGFDRLTRGHPAYINLPQRFLEEPELIPLDPEQAVLEVLETVDLNERCIDGIRRLRERGFTIALDDFTSGDAFDAILPLVDIVKLDVLALPADAWAGEIERLRAHGCRLLAEKVETREAFETLRGLGVDYFQGFFFARPRVYRGRQLPPGRVTLVQALAGLNDPDSTVDDIHELVSRDVALAVKALTYVNSAACGLSRRVDSIREAIVYLGRDRIRRWVSLFVLASAESEPDERMTLALQRAKLCELIAARGGRQDPDACFTVGLFSMLDTLLDTPLAEVLQQMNLSADMRAALLAHAGGTGAVLGCARRLESGDSAEVDCLGIDSGDLGLLLAEAVCWTDEVLRELGLD
ncbi:MAG: EAL and HDOD domain-containing protein [Pseudohaliea sp.]